MRVTVDDDRNWAARLAPSADTLVLTYQCPTCTTPQELRLQAGPTLVPADPERHATMTGTDGHYAPGFADYERERAAGELVHEVDEHPTTQLWCHRCQVGAVAVLHP